MKKITEDYKVETFETGFENFYMDVVVTKDLYEIWIYRKDIGIKDFVVGAKFTNLDEVVTIMEDYLKSLDIFGLYDERYY